MELYATGLGLDFSIGIVLAVGIVFASIFLYLWREYLNFWYYQLSPVSYPGDRKLDPLTRLANWHDKESTLIGGWKFFTAEWSHAITMNLWRNELPLLGEAAGRHSWVFLNDSNTFGDYKPTFNPALNPNSADKPLRGLYISRWNGERPNLSEKPDSAVAAARKGACFFQMLQCEDGHWAGDYGGPMFLLPGLIIAHYVTRSALNNDRIGGMQTYLFNHQQTDGGWGTHIECASTMFGTVLSYVSLRLLNVESSHPSCVHAREFILSRGGALMTTSWAKFWLAVLGVYDWNGINSVPAEMWMLPRWFPFHPGKMWCHSRMVYLPMCYLYSRRWTYPDANTDPLILELRDELYIQPYNTIDWDRYRHACHPDDAYSPSRSLLRFVQNTLAVYERWGCIGPLRWLRNRGIAFAAEYMKAEDIQTNYIDIGPVNKAFHIVVTYAESGGDSSAVAFQRHLQRVDDYLWVAEDGMKMQGYNGSQCWDTSFMLQALVETGLANEFQSMCQKGFTYMQRTQIRNDEVDRERYFRHISKGGWPFSTAAHGWPIADCTAEALKAVLALANLPCIQKIGLEIDSVHLFDAINLLLSLQNRDGGWSTYENNRGYGWYESLNPSEVFGDIMIDYSYVELTSAAVTALASFAKVFPNHRKTHITRAVTRGARFIRSIQRFDGSWYGSWGVCFTYGSWFGIIGLVAAALDRPITGPDRVAISRAVTFLLARQNPNGGFGESYLACVNKEYPSKGTDSIENCDLGTDGSGVVQTAWAMMALIAADLTPEQLGYQAEGVRKKAQIRVALERAAAFLRFKQLKTGDWPQEGIVGVFNRSCGITYSNYRNIFPIWALGIYGRQYESTS